MKKNEWIAIAMASLILPAFAWKISEKFYVFADSELISETNKEDTEDLLPIPIDEEHFPEEPLRKIVKQDFDKNRNSILDPDEITKAKILKLYSNIGELHNLQGVEYLAYLEELYCPENQITKLDLSQNSKLKTLVCYGNKISDLEINPLSLERLDCSSNYLRVLNLDDFANLVELNCCDNDLVSLNVKHNAMLKELHCGVSHYVGDVALGDYPKNQIKSLDLSENRNLQVLHCDEIPISKITFEQKSELRELVCDRTALEELDLHSCTKLRILSCEENRISKLDLSQITFIKKVNCSKNQLTELDLTGNKYVMEVNCSENSIKTLPFKKQDKLEILNCSKNQLTELDVSQAKILREIDCSDNQIGFVDLSNKPKLEKVAVDNNQLTELPLTEKCPLKSLSCSNNQIRSLHLSDLVQLKELNCSQNLLSELDLSTCTRVEKLDCSFCAFSELDLKANTHLLELYCQNNPLTALDPTKANKLLSLNCSNCKLESIDLTRNDVLEKCNVSNNALVDLDLLYCKPLAELDCSGNKLIQLDVTPLTSLQHLRCEKNAFIALDIRQCETLIKLMAKEDLKCESRDDAYYYSSPSLDATLSLDQTVKLIINEDRSETGGGFEAFVERLYTVALNRQSDPQGKSFWVDQVVEKGKTGADCARYFLLDAPEFMKRNLSVEDFVETLYQTFFNRASDAQGKQGWVNAIRGGKKTRVEVVNDFIESTEWCNVCADYGVRSGAIYHKAARASQKALGFATRLYTCCLNRAPESNGLEYWSLALTNLEKNGAEAAQFFFESEEFIGYKTSNREYLLRLYTTFMDRAPAENEMDYWLGEMSGGRQNRHSILAFFAQSPEFTKICKSYGIERGTIA